MAKFTTAVHQPTDRSAAAPRLASAQTPDAQAQDHVVSRISALASHNRRAIVLATHLLVAAVAYLTAFSLRFDFQIPAPELTRLIQTLPFVLVLRVGLLEIFGVSGGSWRHVGLRDLVTLSLAATAGSLALVAALFFTDALEGMSRSVLVMDWLIFIFLAGGVRFAIRCAREGQLPLQAAHGRRTIVIGAGEASERLLRQSFHDGRRGMRFVGLVDDNPGSHGRSLHGVRVLGPISELQALAKKHRVELLVIAIPSASGEDIRRIVTACEETGLEFKRLPSLEELLDGTGQPGQLKDVEIEDLLGRKPVYLDLARVEHDLAGQTVLVTGGAGSIGSELARQIAGFAPRRLILLEQAESPLYFVHLELSKNYPGLDVVPIIGDITDAKRVEAVFAQYQPDYVFHAAAYKHVPMMETNVAEAITNNVLGTLRVAEGAARHGSRKFVLISTDKAVNPSSVMGTTKRLAERIVLGWPALCSSRTDFRAVRFGNVLGSDGSVVPLFRKQLASGGPLTVTHPDVRRYFMSVPEAVQLVLQASALPDVAGRIAMLDMGQPIRIVDLAEQLIRLSGRIPHRDIHITFTGLRPGEKLDEELTSMLESSVPTDVEKIRIVETNEMRGASLESGLQSLFTAVSSGTHASMLRELRKLVPEYRQAGMELEVPITPVHEVDVTRSSDRNRVPAFRLPHDYSDLPLTVQTSTQALQA
jgi:FlaA1/EpsC-like NDP-sugar epimerase